MIIDSLKKVAVPSKVVGAILLISGTSVGGGMLALPVSTAKAGVLPSTFLFCTTWVFMTFTAFVLLECNLSVRKDANLISMSNKTLGALGKGITWSSYLLLLYSLLAAYIAGTSSLIKGAFSTVFKLGLPSILIQSFVLIFTILVVLYGIKFIDKVNRLLILGGAFCYFLLLFALAPHVQSSSILRADFSSSFLSFPIIVTAFGFHIIIPILVRYLDRNVQMLKMSLMVGSIIPLMLYLAWQLAVQGALPFDGEEGLKSIMENENQLQALIESISMITQSKFALAAASCFCGFAIITSLMGVALSLWDFFRDVFSFDEEKLRNQLLLLTVTFIPAFFLVLWFSEAFAKLLAFAGIFVSILLGLLPIAMCIKGRRLKNWGENYQTKGGMPMLIIAALFFAFVIIVECISV